MRKYTLRLCFAAAVILYAGWRSWRNHQDIRYTVATTTGKIQNPRTHGEIGYQFSVDNRLFKAYGAALENKKIVYPNGRYYLRFPHKTPGAAEILWDQPVPDSVSTVPLLGRVDRNSRKINVLCILDSVGMEFSMPATINFRLT